MRYGRMLLGSWAGLTVGLLGCASTQLVPGSTELAPRIATNVVQPAAISPDKDGTEWIGAASSAAPPVIAVGHTDEVDPEFEVDPAPVFSEPIAPVDHVALNLPTALSMVGGSHPAVGLAQWRVQEAYAQFDRAKVLWLPSLQPGFSFHRHDGNYQASDGRIVDVNRNSFQYGLGAGATGAGTTPRPGVVAQFHMAEAIFQPSITKRAAWAEGHARNAVLNDQLLAVSLAYMELLDAQQDLILLQETRDRTEEVAKLTQDFAETGEGLQADADRLQTELVLVTDRLASGEERVEVASARLAEALSLDLRLQIVPTDISVLPIELIPAEFCEQDLISTALANRPELKEAQTLVSVACQRYRQEKAAPLVPSVLLGLSTGEFGGGLGNRLDDVEGRYDFDAMATWQIRNLGFGEAAARREAAARIEQAKFSHLRVMDQVAREVCEASAQVRHRSTRIAITRSAIQYAEDSHKRNLGRIRNGQGLPLEVLQSVRALEDARRAYLRAVIEHNQAQFRLQRALGWPVDSVPSLAS